MKRLPLALVLILLGLPTLVSAQKGSIGVRAGFNGAPSSITGQYFMSCNHALELQLGHTSIKGDGPLMQRGAMTVGMAYRPMFLIGQTCNAPAGFYAQVGARLRAHLNNIQQSREMSVVSNGSGTHMTPEAYGGGGVFVRIAQTIELYGEANLGFGSPRGREYGMLVETGLGMRLLFH